jgi:hypothetical protein
MSSSAFTPTTTQVTTEVPVNVPVVTATEIYTVTVSQGTLSSQRVFRSRSGDRLIIQGNLVFSAGNASTSPVEISLPSGLTADLSKVSSGTGALGGNIGSAGLFDISAAKMVSLTAWTNSTTFGFSVNGSSENLRGADIGAGDYVNFFVSIPISQWAGSGTTTLADRALEEYASNSGGQGTAAATSYTNASFVVYGSNGSLIPSVGSTTPDAATEYIVRFQSQILPTDTIILELNRFGSWLPIASGLAGTGAVMYQRQASAYYGIGFNQINGSTTDCLVQFGNYGARPPGPGGSFAGLGETWSTYSSVRWRLRKVSSGAQVGYPISTKNIVGATDGVAPVTGMLGEVVSSSGSVTVANNVISTISTITLQPGNWEINAAIDFSFIGAASPSAGSGYSISISTSTSFSGLAGSDSQALNPFSSIASTRPLGNLRSKRYINVPQGSTQIIYLLAAQATAVNLTGVFLIDAKRIA